MLLSAASSMLVRGGKFKHALSNFRNNQKGKRRVSDDHRYRISNVLKKGINIKIHHCPSKQAYNRQNAESLKIQDPVNSSLFEIKKLLMFCPLSHSYTPEFPPGVESKDYVLTCQPSLHVSRRPHPSCTHSLLSDSGHRVHLCLVFCAHHPAQS